MVLGLTYLLDILLLTNAPLWRHTKLRIALAWLATAALSTTSAYIALLSPGIFSTLVLLLSIYRILNYTRIAVGRVNHHALLSLGRRSIQWLNGLQLLTLALWFLWGRYGTVVAAEALWYIWAAGILLASIVALHSAVRTLDRTRIGPARDGMTRLATNELPTVTVAVSAHNNPESLVACLDSILASTYPKLEVLALDEGKQQKRTPEIIKTLAQKGVRFLEPSRPRDGWLARNQAYDQLSREASGEYLLFLGADVHLQPSTIRSLVEHAHTHGKQMLSVAPLGPDTHRRASLALVMRYIWEFVPPRRRFRRPPVLTSSWLISRAALKRFGGMGAVKRAVTPEAYFAGALLAMDGYGFVRSSRELGVRTDHRSRSHLSALIRSRYPALHRHIEFAALMSIAYVGVIVAPLILIVFWLVGVAPLAVGLLAVLAYGCFMVSAALVYWNCQLGPRLLGLTAYPAAALLDLAVIHVSLWRYEFGDINWRGRSAVEPVMQVEKHLPRF